MYMCQAKKNIQSGYSRVRRASCKKNKKPSPKPRTPRRDSASIFPTSNPRTREVSSIPTAYPQTGRRCQRNRIHPVKNPLENFTLFFHGFPNRTPALRTLAPSDVGLSSSGAGAHVYDGAFLRALGRTS